MTTTERRPMELAEAQLLACRLLDMLDPVTTRRQVVGSVRRRKPICNDIEILAEPLLTPVARDLFGNVTGYRDELACWCREQLDAGVFGHRLSVDGKRADGDRYKRLTFEGVAFDLFICRQHVQQWGVLEASRTGPAEFSRRLVTQRAYGGMLPFGYAVREGVLYRGATQIETPDERALFAAIGAEYVEPEARR